MTILKMRLALVAAGALALAALPLDMQAATAAAARPSKPAAPARPATRAKKAVPPPVEPPPPAEADEEQLSAAEKVYYGVYECEFKQSVEIVASPKHKGYVDVKHAKSLWLMKPVLSSTGAIRLEDVRVETLMVQISSKSMLLNVKTGHRIVDECVSPRQRELIDAARARAAEVAAAASAASASGAVGAAAAASSASAAAVPGAAVASTGAASAAAAPASAPAIGASAAGSAMPASGAMPMPAASAR